jgi:hypothetical protein
MENHYTNFLDLCQGKFNSVRKTRSQLGTFTRGGDKINPELKIVLNLLFFILFNYLKLNLMEKTDI